MSLEAHIRSLIFQLDGDGGGCHVQVPPHDMSSMACLLADTETEELLEPAAVQAMQGVREG